MLQLILKALRAGVVTGRYPDEREEPPPGFRGAPEIRGGSRFADLPHPSICPSGAIVSAGADAGARYTIDLARCIFCGRCGAAAEGPIEIGRAFELAARERQALVVEARAGSDGRVVAIDPGAMSEARVATQIRRTLGRSLHLRHLDAGSCNACDWELAALLNPTYDCRRLGIDFVASPRHADGVIVTGPVTRNLEPAVLRTFEAVPAPRIVIAVGACAASGGIVGRGYASAGGVGEVLPVDVYVPGCPPRPEAILYGILLALGRLSARPRAG